MNSTSTALLDEPFVLLDDALAPEGQKRSRLYTGWRRTFTCHDPASLEAVWQQARAEQDSGAHLVMWADYEWGVRLHGVTLGAGASAPGVLSWVAFDRCEWMDVSEVALWLSSQDPTERSGVMGAVHDAPSVAGVLALQPDQAPDTYRDAIHRIQDWIRAGDTYQVNHTLRLQGDMVGSPLALYRRLRARQPVAFGALARWPQGHWIVSCSPELFVRHEQGRLQTRPMKGTVARATDPERDGERRAWLAADPKNRAENLMIVDLLRNDLGRIARVGSVRVPRLFEIEAYPTVYQMTSTVEAEPRAGVSVPEVLRALFPCGSITGAPKHHTMALIDRLEPSPRGIYTGAIGWIDAPSSQTDARPSLPDFCWSVAIRTLEIGGGPTPDSARRPVRLGVGGGIVLDSVADEEAEEALLKARFVTACDPGFTLFETVRVVQGRAWRWSAHLARLQASAQALGFTCDGREVTRVVEKSAAATLSAIPPGGGLGSNAWGEAETAAPVFRLRLDLSRDGTCVARVAPLAPLAAGPVRLGWADRGLTPLEAELAAHKTSCRATYDAAIRRCESVGWFDALHVNARGEVTEGARSALRVRLAGRWFTPALSSGGLPSLIRAEWLADPLLGVEERVLTRADVDAAEAWCVGNALRGSLEACRPQ